jgi:hypothetical protein
MKKIVFFLSIFAFFSLFSSCNKSAGEGGTSIIKGKVYVENYNSSGTAITSEFYGQDFDVYIIYGADGTYFNDKIATSYDGSFEFPYLAKGKYQIFVYSKCFNTVQNPCPSGQETVLVSAEITKNKSTVDVGTITIKD